MSAKFKLEKRDKVRKQIATTLSTYEPAQATPASRSRELLRYVDSSLMREAYENGMNFSTYLETLDPSHDQEREFRCLDAFQRLLMNLGIRTNKQFSVAPSMFEDLLEARVIVGAGNTATEKNVGQVLAREWMARQFRREAAIQAGQTVVPPGGERAVFLSGDNTVGSTVNPFVYSPVIRYPRLEPAIPLSALVAFQTGIASDTYKSFYIAEQTAQTRLVRVTEGAELPEVKIIGGDHEIRLSKFGRKLVITYEKLRRMTLDIVSFHLQWISIQTEVDKVAVALDVIVNGDGNANTAATNYNLTALDTTTTANNLTLDAWIAFRMKFVSPYMMTTVLAQEAMAQKLMKMNYGTANTPFWFINDQMGIGGFDNINPSLRNRLALGWTADAPANKIVGFDSRLALEEVVEIGANIQEMEREITNQTQVITMSETNGFKIFDQRASKVMSVNA